MVIFGIDVAPNMYVCRYVAFSHITLKTPIPIPMSEVESSQMGNRLGMTGTVSNMIKLLMTTFVTTKIVSSIDNLQLHFDQLIVIG